MRRNNFLSAIFALLLVCQFSGCDVFFPDGGSTPPAPAPAPKPDEIQPDLGIRDPHGIRPLMKAAGMELQRSELVLLYGAFDGAAALLSTDKLKATDSTATNKLVAAGLKAAGWEKTDGNKTKAALNTAYVAYKVAESRPLVGTDGCKQDLIDMYRLLAAGVSDAYKEVAAHGPDRH